MEMHIYINNSNYYYEDKIDHDDLYLLILGDMDSTMDEWDHQLGMNVYWKDGGIN